eukprot:s91_g2.t1
MVDLHLDDNPIKGQPWTGLLQVIFHDEHQCTHLVKTAIKGRFLRFKGLLPKDTSVVLACRAQVSDDRTLERGEDCRVFPKPCLSIRNVRKVAELCSGIGCLGVGLEEAGFEVVVRCDWNEPMLQLASQLHSSKTLQSDVCSDDTLIALHSECPEFGSVAAGVSCQPYSRLGDQRAEMDPRAQTLPSTLRASFLSQVGFIFLECVDDAMKCQWVQKVISQFAAETGYCVSQGTLSLQQVWPARRQRWWCTLSHPAIGSVPWRPFPEVCPPPTISQVLDNFQACDPDMLYHLQLDLYELGKFSQFGFHSNMVPWNGQMATSLHSCGNQLGACPCGCRKYPFTDRRLQTGGLHGLLIQLPGESKCGTNVYPNFRHITPDELALFNGMFPGCQWGSSPRMALCALGQLASPLQAVWIGACAMQHVFSVFDLGETTKPEFALQKLMGNLLQARDECFGIQNSAKCRSFAKLVFTGTFISAGPIPSLTLVGDSTVGPIHTACQDPLEKTAYDKAHFRDEQECHQSDQDNFKAQVGQWEPDMPPKESPHVETGMWPSPPTSEFSSPKTVDLKVRESQCLAETSSPNGTFDANIRTASDTSSASEAGFSADQVTSSRQDLSVFDRITSTSTEMGTVPRSVQPQSEGGKIQIPLQSPDSGNGQNQINWPTVDRAQLVQDASRRDHLHQNDDYHGKGPNIPLPLEPGSTVIEAMHVEHQSLQEQARPWSDKSESDQIAPPNLDKSNGGNRPAQEEQLHLQESQTRSEEETMVIFVKHEESIHPMPYTVPKDATAGRLTHAEAKLGTFSLPVTPRSLVGTHVPLDAEMHPNQYVLLHQKMPDSHRCPFVSSKFSDSVQIVELGLPCTRFEALWHQQAWVANDEMDYYLEAVQVEGKALPFPTAVFHNEAEASEWAHEWLAVAMDTEVLDKPWCSAAIVGAHWIPMVLRQHGDVIMIDTTPEGNCFLDSITQIAHRQGKKVECHQKILPQAFSADCGFQRPGLVCFDVENAVERFDFEWEAPLLDYTGARLIEDSNAPNFVFLGITAKTLDFWEILRSPVAFRDLAQGFVTTIPQNQVHAFIHWIERTGTHALVKSCGWHFLSQLTQDPLNVPVEVYLLPRSDRLPVTTRAICQLVIERIFINQIKFYVTNPMLGNGMVRFSLKLWRTWVWSGQVGNGETTQFIHQAWKLAHEFFGDATPIRLITQGVQINPEWPISHYVQTSGEGEQLMKVHVVLQLHGGGPSPDQPPRTIHEAYSFQELEDLEQADANRLISILIQNLIEVPAEEQHLDIDMLRNATLRQDGPSFSMVGSVASVVRLLRDLSTTGIEALLRAMGWITAMSISDCREPVQVQLHVMPKAGVRHLSLTTVQSFMAHALTIRAMPIPSGLAEGIQVKVKLADSWVLVGRFPPNVRMAIFIDPWYKATSFFGRPSRLRIICNSAQANPDRCLVEYARTNELGEQFAKLFLVLQLQGGGPKICESPKDDAEGEEAPHETVLLTVPEEKDQRLLRMSVSTTVSAALGQIRPGEELSDWTPLDSFGYKLDWDMTIHGLACVHFVHHPRIQEDTNGLIFLLHNHCQTSVSEIEFHLRLKANESQYKPIAPICVTAAKGSHVRNRQLRQWLEGLLEHAMASGRPVASLCLVDQHWIPFVAHVSFDILQVQTTIEGMELLPQIERCCRRPHQPMPHSPPLWLRLPVNFLTRQIRVNFPGDCGYQGIVWLMNHICTRPPKEMLSISEALQWRDRYLQHLACWDTSCLYKLPDPSSLGGANSDETQEQESQCSQLEPPSKLTKCDAEAAQSDVSEGVYSCLKVWDQSEEHAQPTPGQEALGLYDAWIGARLCAKTPGQLQNLPAPNPVCSEQLEAVREQLMSRDHRVQLLTNQGQLWADDEIVYHLDAISNMVGAEHFVEIIDPLVARAWLIQNPPDVPNPKLSARRVVTVLHHGHHWTPLIFIKHGAFLNVHTWARNQPIPSIVEAFVQTIQNLMGCSNFRWILYHTRVTVSQVCGVLAIALVGHVLLQLPLPQQDDEVSKLDGMLKKRFAKNLPVFCMIPSLWASGEHQQELKDTESAINDGQCPSSADPSPEGTQMQYQDQSMILGFANAPDSATFQSQFDEIFPCTRIEALHHQGPRVANDEMNFYLEVVGTKYNTLPLPAATFPHASEECQVGAWIKKAIQTNPHDKSICMAAMVGQHWIPVVVFQHPSGIQICTTAEGSRFVQPFQQTFELAGETIESNQVPLPHLFTGDCGFQALAWIIAQVTGMQYQYMPVEQAVECRFAFAQYLFRTHRSSRLISSLPVGGAKPDNELIQGLVSLLRDHGVWPERAVDRATKIADVIPPASIKSILSSRKPWADLKHAANQAKPPMKLIMQDELDAQIAARSKHRSQFGRKPVKQAFRQPESTKDILKLTASDLQVPVGVFKQQDGVSLGPLQADQVGNNAEGVVLIDEHEAQAMLKLPTPVTHKGLAVLVLATKENAQLHEADPIRFPALCLSTQEPLIASGYLYQLGSLKVERQEPSVKLAVDERATEAIRCLVFRDQATLWDSMQNHPVKTIFSNEPLLQQDSQSEPVVIDVWDRQWVTKRFEKTKAASAELFAFSFRMLADKSNELIAKSGTNGIYYEPRSACGRYPSDTHHVTWLPNTKFQEAKYAQQTSPQLTSLVRHADRYGLRSDTFNAQQIHEKHRPDTPLLLGSSKMLYMLGPLPFSTTKEAVTKLLKAWGWEARPLQPRGRSQDGSGVTWCIQATADPSHWIYVLQHGDVLISKLQEDKPNDAAQSFSIVASKKTMWHLHNNAETDPLQVNDPWKPKASSNKPLGGPHPQTTNMHPATLANMEATLEKRILANITQKMPNLEDVPMDSMDSRVSQLESQIAQIQNHQQTVDNKLTQVDQSVQHVQATQQGIESSVNQMQQQMEHQNVHLAQTIDRKMSEQLERLESLFMAKRGRPHIFGNANTTGLMGKSANLAALGKTSATFAVQETHLTAQGISRFRKEMIWQKTKFTMTHGAPAPPKNHSLRTLGGKHTGVAFLSTHPIRTLAHHWNKQDFDTGRCLATAAYIDQRWITMGTVYGFNEGAHSVEVQQHTDRLLTGLTSRIVDGAQGLRMISGDWNLDRSLIPQADYWEAKGWVEAQQLANRLWNRPIMCTCKKTTVKDFLYLSPEMIPYVEDVQLDWNHFADHATILVFLREFDKPPKLPMWRKPKPLQWTKPTASGLEWACEVVPNVDTDKWYQDLWEDVEKYADHLHSHANMPKAAPHQKGRAATKEEFTVQYRSLEASLTKTRFEYAKQRRTKDPMLIYRDLQKDRAEPVQTIVQKVTLPFQQSSSVDNLTTLTFAEPLPESIQTVSVNQIPVQVQQTGAKEIRMDTTTADQLEGHIVLHKNVGDIPSILAAFEAEWKPRWQRHDEVNPAHWDPAIDFFKTALPHRQVEFPPITIELWRKTVSKKKKGAAIGPDGVSKQDLLAMPDSTLNQMLQIIHAVENGSDWPSQAVTGLVAALAKKPTAAAVGEFRPICIFSIFYRTWSTLRGKQCLQFLQSIVPQTLLGNIPGRSPKKLWYHVQQCIEHAYGSTDEIAGTVIDLVKCFNTLPRKVLQDLATHIGIPWTVVGPWSKALQQMTRRFQVRGAIGQPLLSTTGYPEGCALSVVAMAICNVGLEVYMFHRFPRVQTWSFVDNIELLATSANDAIDACEGLNSFCELLDLQIDEGKSYLWCNTATGRKTILTSGRNRRFYARDLGGHLNYTKICSNATIQDKIVELTPFWSRLARSCAPISQKERSLYVCAWPNLFYGISTVTLGNNHFLKLRTLATKALNLHQMGSTPALQLSCLSNPFCDPEFYCVHATIMSFRDFATPDLAEYTLRRILETGQTTPGPCKSFLLAIHKLGWRWHRSDWCVDQDQLPIHVLGCPKTELTERIMAAWQQRVFSQVAMERSTMGGLYHMDAKLTRQLFAKQPLEHQGLLRCALNGTQYTQDALFYAGKVESPACKFCGQSDSLEHRYAHCPFFEDIRKQFPEAAMPPDVSAATACHGWIPKASHLNEFRRQLLNVEDTTAQFFPPSSVSPALQYLDIFIDGSCVRPHDSTTRVATWGTVLWDGTRFCSLSCGGVQGLRQTSLRAEICAAISALKFLALQETPGRLWVDNKQVYSMLDSWIRGGPPGYAHKRDSDLWYLLFVQFQHSADQIQEVLKVQAHLQASEQAYEVDS